MPPETTRNATLAISLNVTAHDKAVEAAFARYRAAKAEMNAAFRDLAKCMGVSAGDVLVNGEAVNAA